MLAVTVIGCIALRCRRVVAVARTAACAAGAVAGSLVGGVFEPVQEVAVVDGDHDLRTEPSRDGECIRGQGYLAGADEPVQELLRPGPPVQIRHPVLGLIGVSGAVTAAAPAPKLSPTRCCFRVAHSSSAGSGAGVGGGVHHGQQGFVLVRGGENFHVVQSAAGRAEEHPLTAAPVPPRTVRTRPGRSPQSTALPSGTGNRRRARPPRGSGRAPSGPWCLRGRGPGPGPTPS